MTAANPEDIIFFDEVPLYKWKKKCWHKACRKETTIVSYDLEGGESFHIGSVPKLDKLLMEKYPHIKEVYSKTMESRCIANVCEHCGRIQGNWFVMEDILQFKSAGIDMNKLLDCILPLSVSASDLGYSKEDIKTMNEEDPDD